MSKYIGLLLIVVVCISAGVGVGWMGRGGGEIVLPEPNGQQTMNMTKKYQQTALDKADYWKYPHCDDASSGQGGSLHIASFITKDDFATVLAWYTQRFGEGTLIGSPFSIGVHGGPDTFMSSCDDSYQPTVQGKPKARGAKSGVIARSTPASAVTVSFNQVDGEEHTHIVVSYTQLEAE